MTAMPANTVAVVVGIEEYATGRRWRLDGPALDACRFAGWLTGRGVPPEKITLLVSPLPENATVVAEKSRRFPHHGPAEYSMVRKALTRNLYQSRSDLLILYWGGHGVLDEADDHRLICADATLADMRNLNLTSLLRALRSSSYPGHRRQLILVDACQSPVRDLGWVNTMPDERLPRGHPEYDRDQRGLLAAGPGEQAVNDDARKSGLFSLVMSDTLTTLPRGHWPPDAEALRHNVRERFERLRDEGRTRQMPTHLWSGPLLRDRETWPLAPVGRQGPISTAVGEPRLLNRAQYKELKRILNGAPAPAALRALYQDATRHVDGFGPPRHPDDLMSSVDALRDPVSSMPLFEFLVRLAAGSDTVTRRDLWKWIRKVAPDYEVDMAALEEVEERLRRTFLLLCLRPDAIGVGHLVTAWVYAGRDGRQVVTTDDPWTRGRLAGELSRLIDGLDLDLDQDGDALVVEFLVPLDMLDDGLETIPVRLAGTEREIGAVCPVVVRALDRLADPAWREPWQVKWRELTARDAYDANAICWIDRALDDGRFDPAALSRHGHVCTALAHEHAAGPHKDQILRAAWGVGTPVVVWHRHNGVRRSRRQALEQVLGGRALRELPEVVRDQRAAARDVSAPVNHAGRDLVLLWDDPDRIPHEPLEWYPPTREGDVP